MSKWTPDKLAEPLRFWHGLDVPPILFRPTTALDFEYVEFDSLLFKDLTTGEEYQPTMDPADWSKEIPAPGLPPIDWDMESGSVHEPD